MKGRRGTSFVELMVSVGVFLVLVGILMSLWVMGSKMGAAAGLAGSMQTALILQEHLLEDIHQLATDPNSATQFQLGATGLSFYRARFEREKIKLVPVRWHARRNAAGLLDLVRTEGSTTKVYGEGLLADVRFASADNTYFDGHAFNIRFTVLESARDPRGLTREERDARTHRFLVRVPARSMMGIAQLDPAARMEVDGRLLPVR